MTTFPRSIFFALVTFVVAELASAHGAMEYPINRVYNCYKEGPESLKSEACKAAKAVGGPSPIYNWTAVSQNAGGNDLDFVPDGKLCSGGNSQYQGFDLAREDWVKTNIDTSGPITLSFYGTAPHSTKRWSVYISNDEYQLTDALTWSDLDKFCELGNVTVDNNQRYNLSCTLPQGYDGDRIIYAVWERNDSWETFYSCSDVHITGLGRHSDKTDDTSNEDRNMDVIELTQAELFYPEPGSVLDSSEVTFNVDHHDSAYTVFEIGSSPDNYDVFKGDVINNTIHIDGLPMTGETLYVTLWSDIDGERLKQSFHYPTVNLQISPDEDTSEDETVKEEFVDYMGDLTAETHYTEGTTITLRLMDVMSNGELEDLDSYQLDIKENMGDKALWPWYLATLVNEQSAYIRIGQLGAEQTLLSVEPIKMAEGNGVYAEPNQYFHFELDIALPEKPIDNLVVSPIDLQLTASKNSTEGLSVVSVSGAQSTDFDIQNAQYLWQVTAGEAVIVAPLALTTEIQFSDNRYDQDVELSLTVISGEKSATASLVIAHKAKPVIEEVVVSAEKDSGGGGSAGFASLALLGLLAIRNRLLIKKQQSNGS